MTIRGETETGPEERRLARQPSPPWSGLFLSGSLGFRRLAVTVMVKEGKAWEERIEILAIWRRGSRCGCTIQYLSRAVLDFEIRVNELAPVNRYHFVFPVCKESPSLFFMGIASLRSTVREASVRSIFRQQFFPFLETFLSLSEKNKFRHFFMIQIIFQVKIWWVEKISRNKLVRYERNLSSGRNKKCTSK